MCFLVTFAVAMFVVGLSGALTWTIALAPSAAIYVFQSCFILRYLLPFQFRNGFAEFIPPGSSVCLSRMYWGFLLETVFEKLCCFSFISLALLRAAQTGGEDTSKLISFWIVFTPLILLLWVHDTCFCRTKIFCGNSGGAVMSPEPDCAVRWRPPWVTPVFFLWRACWRRSVKLSRITRRFLCTPQRLLRFFLWK
ncbi:putative heat shock protein [Trypanosoma cruzi]|uniref:Putative heat shock protein n=1 Tax=Trypanosoma cruzi TaxID=5693 RepID=A0A2V2WAD2_TRYCR|nr:putative heat shock protein [Trypanosoma cruzi]